MPTDRFSVRDGLVVDDGCSSSSSCSLKLKENLVTLLLYNIQSVRNKVDELTIFLEQLNMPCFILLTEHWLREGEPCHLTNYIVAARFNRQTLIHGGTMILVHREAFEGLKFCVVECCNFLLVKKEFEFSIVHEKVNNLFIICIYRPPGCSVTVFLERLEMLLSSLPLKSRIVLGGDLNINFDDTDSAATRALSNLLISFNLTMHVMQPTRISQYSESVIDYVCTNFACQNCSCCTVAAGLSDHEAVMFSFSLGSKIMPKKFRYGRIYSGSNYLKFSESCQMVDWEELLDAVEPLSIFHGKLVELHDSCFPLCKLKVKKSKPWITNGIRVSACNLRSLQAIKKFTTNEFFITYFKEYRCIYRKVVSSAKKSYYSDRLNKAVNRSRETWSIINSLRGKMSDSPSGIDVDPNILNEYYTSIAGRVTSCLKRKNHPLEFLRDAPVGDDFYFRHTNLQEVTGVINKIRNRRTSGIDGITVNILMNLPLSALSVLVKSINRSFDSGVFPASLKAAIVVPLYKGGVEDEPSNYRPISLLSTISKLVERIAKERILDFLNTHNILMDCQFGFRDSRGTQDAVFSFLREIYVHLNDNEATAVVFCDFSKAFDCVSHEILLQKLDYYGFRGSALTWIRSYLSDRKQSVRIRGSILVIWQLQQACLRVLFWGPFCF